MSVYKKSQHKTKTQYRTFIHTKTSMMSSLNWIIITLGILYITVNAGSDKNLHGLPHSIVELEQYYNFISNLEKRGVINQETANQ